MVLTSVDLCVRRKNFGISLELSRPAGVGAEFSARGRDVDSAFWYYLVARAVYLNRVRNLFRRLCTESSKDPSRFQCRCRGKYGSTSQVNSMNDPKPLATRVRNSLRNIGYLDITATNNGQGGITLAGSVPTAEDRMIISASTRAVPGVTCVLLEIALTEPGNLRQ